MLMASVESKKKTDADTFWRKLTLPEEDRRRLFPGEKRVGGYRWFRSPNVVCLEKFRRLKVAGRV